MSLCKATSFRAVAKAAPKVGKRAMKVRAGGDYGWYPEPGTYPGSGEEAPVAYDGDAKLAEREIIHGRFAMLGLTGAWAAEVGTGIPWFEAGALCTPSDCTAIADKFPGAIYPLAPPDSGFPNFFVVLGIEVVFFGLAEAYRTGLVDPVFDELTVGDAYPGGRFDPLGLAADPAILEENKVKELKHARLAMLGWSGCLVQWLATGKGPLVNWAEHVADPFGPTYAWS
jgi:light-harvesting complex II chlorophyll a/b binding protein 4